MRNSSQGSQSWRVGATAIHEPVDSKLPLHIVLDTSDSAQNILLVVIFHDYLYFYDSSDGPHHAILEGLDAKTFLGFRFETHVADEM